MLVGHVVPRIERQVFNKPRITCMAARNQDGRQGEDGQDAYGVERGDFALPDAGFLSARKQAPELLALILVFEPNG